MEYIEVLNAYQELKSALELKKEAIIKKNMKQLNTVDENIVVLCEKLEKFDLKNTPNNFSEEEKENLRKLGREIKVIQENNEILIEHSLNVINNILSGILNIAQPDKCSYNSKGIGCAQDESLDISSITEEA